VKLVDYNRLAQELGGRPAYLGAVLSVHGMNTYGPWQKNINATLQDACIRHIPVDYGFQIVKVVWPFAQRLLDDVARRVVVAYEDHIRTAVRPGAIGHSFGTLAVGHALRRNPDLALHRVVLFGSILPRNYEWKTLMERGQVERVLNEACDRDPWPRRARYCIPGSGESGCEGFDPSRPEILERKYEWTEHSGLGTALHCANVWVPFLLGRDPP
jgi:hypothetical protein